MERIIIKHFAEIKSNAIFVLYEPAREATTLGSEERIKKLFDEIQIGNMWKRVDCGDHFNETLIDFKPKYKL